MMKRIQWYAGQSAVGPIVACLALVTAVLPVHAELPEVVKQAPAGTQLMLVVPSLRGASDEIAAINQTLGLDAQMDDVLGLAKAATGMVEGVNDEGSLLIAVPNVMMLAAAAQGGGEPPILVLLPVSDYDAFVTSFGGNAADAVTTLTMQDDTPAYARQSQGYAVLSASQAALQMYTPAGDTTVLEQKLGATGIEALAGSDLAWYLDVEAIGPIALPMIDQGLMMGKMQMQAAPGMDPAQAAMAAQMLDIYAQFFKDFLTGSRSLVMGWDASAQGVAFTKAIQLVPGSRLAALFPGGESQAQDMLASLPDRPFVFAMTMDTKAVNIQSIVDTVLKTLPQEGEGGAIPMVDVYRDSLAVWAETDGFASVFYTPSADAMMKGGLLNGMTLYRCENPAKFKTTTRDALVKLEGMSVPLAPNAGADAAAMAFTSTYDENVMEVEGVAVDGYAFQMNVPQELQAQMMPMLMMMGGSGYSGYIASKGNDVLMTTAMDQALLTDGLAAIEAKQGVATGDTYQAVRTERLPKNTVMEAYVSINGVVDFANVVMPMLGMPAVEAPEGLEPLSAGVGVSEGGVMFRSYVPMKAVKFVVDSVMRMAPEVEDAPNAF